MLGGFLNIMTPHGSRITFGLMVLAVFALAFLSSGVTPAKADYDIAAQGIPKFVNSVYIDMRKITRLSKYRSFVGHDYSDNSQFGNQGVLIQNRPEYCRSMKHYFIAPDANVKVYAPVTGTVVNVTAEFLGQQIEFRSDAYPDFRFIIFHVATAPLLAIGDHVTEGQLIGTHGGSETWSDMAVWVQTPQGKHLISYFDTLTDAAFATIQARGVTSREQLSFSLAQRAMNFPCPGFSNPADTEFVNLTGGAATQTITVQNQLPYYRNIGDAPFKLGASASSGLPLTITSLTPKVCAIVGDTVSARRAGVCRVTLSQAGDENTFPANSLTLLSYVLPKGAFELPKPTLSRVYPSSPNGPQSYLRFYNTVTGGTAKASLYDADSGDLYATWTSPPIPPNAAIQYDMATLEAAAAPGKVRPSSYNLKLEASSAFGYMQHVVFDPQAQALMNYSSCGSAVMAPSNYAMNVHSSRLSAGYQSSIVFNHVAPASGQMQLEVQDAASGSRIGFYLPGLVATNTSPISTADMIESQIQLFGSTAKTQYTPTASQFHYNVIDFGLIINSSTRGDFYQHLVTNRQPLMVSDMTSVCAMSGLSTASIPTVLRSTAVYGSGHSTFQSHLRFYNSGTTVGPVSVTLYDAKTGQAFGPWVSPNVPVDAELQFPVADIEAALGLTAHESYGVSVQTDIDGLFQHVVWHAPDGALSNASTCSESVAADPRTLIGVHSALMAKAGYPSAIVIHNTGFLPTTAKLTMYAAYDGTAIGTYTTNEIPANASVVVDVATIEASAGMVPGGHMFHYNVKADAAFTGTLQHLLKNNAAGVTTDMTNVCLM